MNQHAEGLLQVFRTPAAMAEFDDTAWDLILRQAAAAGLSGRLGALALQVGILDGLPRPVQQHMRAMMTVADQQARAVRWELVQLSATLAMIEGPVVLLKGAAYAAAGLAPAAGRLFSDIDILIPKNQLDAAEANLLLHGWHSDVHDTYDQRYYRQWMHELPPMTHIRRQTVLDLHHNILPETARIQTRPDLILADSTSLALFPRFSIPSQTDQILHSATHLFHEGEWEHGLRDLVDLDALLRHYSAEPGFWDTLIDRANLLGLGRPLYYGLRYCRQILATPMPASILGRCPQRPGKFATVVMDALFLPAFSTAHPSCKQWYAGLAVSCLYVRSHWLRMPLTLLLPHLTTKFWRKRVAAMFQKPGVPTLDQ